MTIYEIKEEFQRVLWMAEDPSVDQQTFLDTMESLKFDLAEKADGYGMILTQLKSDSEGLGKEIERLTARKRAIDNKMTWMKTNLQDAMELAGETKIKTERFSFGIQNNPASVVIDDVTAVPAQFLIPQEPKVDKTAIKDLLKQGEQFGWCHLDQGRSLRIR